MFTGIITHLGKISKKQSIGLDLRFTIKADFTDVALGESIAVNGVCLTVTNTRNNAFCVDVSQETLSKSNLKNININDKVNLERSIKASDRLGGHWVSGHVDGVCKIKNIQMQGQSRVLKLSLPKALAALVAAKGSVTLEGISLTVNTVTKNEFSVNIIPHTWEHTTLKYKQINHELNLEVDILARYMQRLLQIEPKVTL